MEASVHGPRLSLSGFHIEAAAAAAAARRDGGSAHATTATPPVTVFPACMHSAQPLRIASYNVYFGNAPHERLPERTAGIAAIAFGGDLVPDVIAFQEVIEESEAILRSAAEAAGYRYLSLHGGAAVEPAHSRGSSCRYWAALAIGHRLEVLSAATHPFTRSRMDRHLVLATCRRPVADGGGLVIVSTAHLESMPPMAAARAMQLAEVDTRIGLAVEKALQRSPELLAAGPPVLVFTGDTNCENGEVRGDGMGRPQRKVKRPSHGDAVARGDGGLAAATASAAATEAVTASTTAATPAASATAFAETESGIPLPAGWSDAWVSLNFPEETRWTFDLSANDTFGADAEGGRRARLDRLFLIDWHARALALQAKARASETMTAVAAPSAASAPLAASASPVAVGGAGGTGGAASAASVFGAAEVAAPPPVCPARMSLLGTSRLPCGRFPSDHWGIVVDLVARSA